MSVLDQLQEVMNRYRPENSDVDPLTIECTVPYFLLQQVYMEIELLRSLAGAVSEGQSGADIKRDRNATGG